MTWKARIAELALGYTAKQISFYAFDYGLYPLVIYWLGLGWGFALMAMFSFLFCWLTMKLYDWSGRDWLGIEAIKGLKDYAGRSWYVQWLGWVLQKSDPVAYVLLSIKFDPFVVTAYFRRGQFNGMAPRDWRIFVLSWLIGNACWSLLCLGGVSALVWLWARLG